jgi:hypothetical protein
LTMSVPCCTSMVGKGCSAESTINAIASLDTAMLGQLAGQHQ